MFKIGDICINGKVVLAPMAGYTSFGYRSYMEKFGCDLTFTEMISDMGIIYGNQETLDYIPPKKTNIPCGVQVFGSNPKNIAKAVEIIEKTAPFVDFFDVNMGCPVNKVIKTGAGSSILKNPNLAGEIIKEIKSVTTKPVTAKIRLGWDDKNLNFKDVILALETAGVDAISIHARTMKQLYHDLPRFSLIKNIRKEMSVPLIISGNIFSVEDAKNALDITGADAVMVARGSLGNPYLITQIKCYLEKGEKLPNPSFTEQCEYCFELARYLIEEKGEEKAMRIYRSIAPKFFFGLPEVKKLNARLSSELTTYQTLVDIIEDYKKTIVNF